MNCSMTVCLSEKSSACYTAIISAIVSCCAVSMPDISNGLIVTNIPLQVLPACQKVPVGFRVNHQTGSCDVSCDDGDDDDDIMMGIIVMQIVEVDNILSLF